MPTNTITNGINFIINALFKKTVSTFKMKEFNKGKDNTIAFIIQARIGSTRLPNKMILPFYNEFSIFEILIDKFKKKFKDLPIILATPSEVLNDILEQTALNYHLQVFRGDESNVLQRFIDTAEHYNIERIIRICADNPFLDINELQKLLSFVEKNPNYDYVSFYVNDTPCIKTHFGFWGEYISLDALKKVCHLTKEVHYYEHVTNYIYEHPNLFNINFLPPNKKVLGRNDIRMTIDTQQDFELLSEIYKYLQNKFGDSWGIDEIISFLDLHTSYRKKMTQQIKQNEK